MLPGHSLNPETDTQLAETEHRAPIRPEPSNEDRKQELDELIHLRMSCRHAGSFLDEDGRDRLLQDMHAALSGTDQLGVLCGLYGDGDVNEFGNVLCGVLRAHQERVIGAEAIERRAEQIRQARLLRARLSDSPQENEDA